MKSLQGQVSTYVAGLSGSVDKGDVLMVLAAAALAVAVRAAWSARSDVYPVEGLDTLWYDTMARSVAGGNGLTNPDDGSPTALFGPGYPFGLGTAYALFGSSVSVAQALNAVAAAATVALVYVVGRTVMDRWGAALGAFLFAVFPSQVIFSSLVMSEILFTVMLMLVVLLALLASRATGHRATLLLALAGASAGAALLTRGQGLILLLIIPVWWLVHHRPGVRLVPLLFFIYGAAMVVLPWSVRNWVRLDAPVLVSTNVGWDAVIGHNEEADGGWMFPGRFFLDTLDLPQPQREVEINEKGVRLAREYARHHPVRELELSGRKAYRLWRSDAEAVAWQEANVSPYLGATERRLVSDGSNAFYFIVLALAGAGLISSHATARGWRPLVLLLAGGWTLFHMLSFAENRFHYPLSPVLALAAASGVVALPQLVDRGLALAGYRTAA